MKDVDDRDGISESTLRRALRFEADEPMPRLDAMAIAAAAERRTVLEQLLRVMRGLALVGVSLGIVAAIAVAAFTWLSDVDPSGLFGLGLSIVAAGAERVMPLTTLVTDPAIPAATFAALVFAIYFERSNGRESISVRAS